MAASMFFKVSVFFTLFLGNYLTNVGVYSTDTIEQTTLESDICSIKSCHSASMKKTGAVYKDCVKHNYTIVDRCCEDTNGTIIGIDLSTCFLKSVPDFHNTTDVEWIALEDNPLSQGADQVHEAFRGLKNIQYLSLPGNVSCPGGENAWLKTTDEKNRTVCVAELNVCVTDNSTYLCPKHSHCVHDGPGLVQCLCNGDLYGYRCLRSGHFPMAIYYGILGGCMVVISAFLWVTQRRKTFNVSVKRD